MKLNIIIAFSIFLMLTFLSCSVAGRYTTRPTSSSAGYELILKKNKSFILNQKPQYSPNKQDSNGNRIWLDPKTRGFGTYEVLSDSIRLSFLNEDSIKVFINKIISAKETLVSVELISEIDKRNSLSIVLLDENLQRVTIISASENRECNFKLNQYPNAKYFRFIANRFMMVIDESVKIDIGKLKAGDNIFKYKTYNGYFAKGDRQVIRFKRTFRGIRFGPKISDSNKNLQLNNI